MDLSFHHYPSFLQVAIASTYVTYQTIRNLNLTVKFLLTLYDIIQLYLSRFLKRKSLREYVFGSKDGIGLDPIFDVWMTFGESS